MSTPDRRAMVERPGKDLSVRRQCTLLNLARSGVYRPKPVPAADDLAVMCRIDELHLELPCLSLDLSTARERLAVRLCLADACDPRRA
jgi:putative transposase